MRGSSCRHHLLVSCRRLTTATRHQCVPVLPDHSIGTFQKAYNEDVPVLLPRQALSTLPAIHKWFITSRTPGEINAPYLGKYGSTIVPLEFSNGQTFERVESSLSYFLKYLTAATSSASNESREHPGFNTHFAGARITRPKTAATQSFNPTVAPTVLETQIYLAQASISDLPQELRDDIPTPEVVKKAGKGDIYDSSIWIGHPPTYTPLHRDPNPNLFVQLAGSKVVRLFRPEVGRGIFAKVQETIGGNASQTIRGEEMMQGQERVALEREVWDERSDSRSMAYQAELKSGDALFIPKGWWHSIRSSGRDVNGSVNWWFR